MKLMVVVFLALVAVEAQQKSYQGFRVFRTEKLRHDSAKLLQNIQHVSPYDFWKEPKSGQSADIMANPDMLKDLEDLLKKNNIKYTVMVDDVEEVIKSTKSSEKPKLTRSNSQYAMNWDDYQTLEVINDFITAIANNNSWAEVTTIGQSYEGRDMKVLSLRKAGDGKPNIWLEAGIHAREWIAPAVATYIIRELVENYDAHPDYLDKLNWYLLPSLNPDGYEYSWNHDRLWRKNRANHNSIFGCKGVDLNRNFGFHWGESGVSHNKCMETYCGPNANSEPETQVVQAYVQSLSPTPVFANCFHSYSQLWMWTYGYAHNAVPDDVEKDIQLAQECVAELQSVHGTVFEAINSADLYPAAGAADDWYKGNLNVSFVYTTELRDKGNYGFLLPADQIIPSGEEMWKAFDHVAKEMIKYTGA